MSISNLKSSLSLLSILGLLFFSMDIHANNADIIIDKRNLTKDDILRVPKIDDKQSQPTSKYYPDVSRMSKEEALRYLKQNPDDFESVLSLFLENPNANALRELLPEYKKYPNRDESVLDWGNAIIAASENNFSKSISLYRKLNSAMPDVDLIRMQLAIVLYRDAQYDASKNEFEKLRSQKLNERYLSLINGYLDAIQKKDKWSYQVGLSYLNDNNITGAPPLGTKLGNNWTYSTPHEAGQGVDYDFSANKKWSFDNKLFIPMNIGTYGKYYWNNKKYNDISVVFDTGLGYQDNKKELQLGPEFSKRWYAGGASGKGDIKQYSDTLGLKFTLAYWLSDNLRFQNYTKYSETDYEGNYSRNNSTDFMYSNTLVYLKDQNKYFYTGADLSVRNSKKESDSFDRKGLRFGWGQAWPLGMSSRLNFGYAKRKYQAPDFFGIKRKNNEYSAGLSLWNRGIYLFELTPRINYNYSKVTSNESFEEYDKHNVSLELTKTF